MAILVCIECSEHTKGCTIITDHPNQTPIICGPDNQGYVRACRWMEVPKKAESKIIEA